MIKVLIVDDSNFMRKALIHMLSSDPEIQVVGESGDGRDGVEKVMTLKPDVVTMDIIMPGVDGLWALEEIMKQRPTPVLILSSIGIKPSDVIKEAFALGVVDVLTKPENPQNIAVLQRELIERIKAAAKVNKLSLLDYKNAVAKERVTSDMVAHQVLVVATSAGGPTSLYEVIPRLTKNFYGAVVVAQHMPVQFIHSFVEHIQTMTPLTVKMGGKGDFLYSRHVYFSPTNATLEVYKTKKGVVTDLIDYKVRLQPDINKTVISCAEAFRSSTVMVVLSGLGDDGVKGAEVVKKYGGKVIVEDESTAGVYSGMPSSVVKSGFYDLLCPSFSIAEAVEQFSSNKTYTFKKKQFMVKGIIFKNILEVIRKSCAKDVVNRILGTLSELGRATVNENVRHYNYYPSDILFELLAGIRAHTGNSQPQMIEELGMENIKECLNAYHTTLALKNVEELNSFVQMFCKLIFPGVSGEIVDLNDAAHKASVLLKSEGFSEENLVLLTPMVKGWVRHVSTVVGIELTELKLETAAGQKGIDLKCLIKWK